MDKQMILQHLDMKAFYSGELPSMKVNGSDKAQALCPFHDDHNPSLSVTLSTGAWNCFGCGSKGSVFDFYMKRLNVNYKVALNALAEKAGLYLDPQKKIVATYDYKDESGTLIFQTLRYEPKDFRQRRPDGNGGWIYNLQGVRLVPYNLPEVIKVDSVIIVEGEKDAETLRGIGLVASCNPMGAGKWRAEYNSHFQSKKVAIIPDNDELGRNHALQMANKLKEIAESVKIVELPELPEKGDVSDWTVSGGTKENLLRLIDDILNGFQLMITRRTLAPN